MRWGVLCLCLFAFGCSRRAEPKLVDVAEVDPTLTLDLRYAGAHNFIGDVIDGYGAAICWLTPAAARALGEAQRTLRSQGFGLVVYDCYRPQRAVNHFVRWAGDLDDQRNKAEFYPNVDKSELFARGYIAERSSHSRGSTVDVGMLHLHGPLAGRPVDMGTEFDAFDPTSHTAATSISPVQQSNRRALVDAMDGAGFENLPVEWWHYTFRDEPYPDTYFDVVPRP